MSARHAKTRQGLHASSDENAMRQAARAADTAAPGASEGNGNDDGVRCSGFPKSRDFQSVEWPPAHLYFLRGTLGSQTGKFSQLRVNFVFKVVLTCTAEGHNTSGDACLV